MLSQYTNATLSRLPGYSGVARIVADGPLSRFSLVTSFFFCCKADASGLAVPTIDLVLQNPEAAASKIGIRFSDIEDVEFSGFGRIGGLYFQSLEQQGLDRIRFEVGDYEDERIHLFCKDISLFDPGAASSPG